jgi:hypothetical protein
MANMMERLEKVKLSLPRQVAFEHQLLMRRDRPFGMRRKPQKSAVIRLTGPYCPTMIKNSRLGMTFIVTGAA